MTWVTKPFLAQDIFSDLDLRGLSPRGHHGNVSLVAPHPTAEQTTTVRVLRLNLRTSQRASGRACYVSTQLVVSRQACMLDAGGRLSTRVRPDTELRLRSDLGIFKFWNSDLGIPRTEQRMQPIKCVSFSCWTLRVRPRAVNTEPISHILKLLVE